MVLLFLQYVTLINAGDYIALHSTTTTYSGVQMLVECHSRQPAASSVVVYFTISNRAPLGWSRMHPYKSMIRNMFAACGASAVTHQAKLDTYLSHNCFRHHMAVVECFLLAS